MYKGPFKLNIDYTFKYLPNGILLEVHKDNYDPIELEKIVTRFIERKKIQEPAWYKIESALKTCKPFKIIIAEAQDEIIIDEEIDVYISEDRMKGYITLYKALGGRSLVYKEIQSYINKYITFGVNESKVKNLVKNKRYNEPILIAEGKVPQNGKDGVLNFQFSIDDSGKPTILEDGTADFHKLNLIKNVEKGEHLIDIIPPEPGQLGKTVLGEDVSYIRGLQPKITYDDSIVAIEDETKLIANKNGQVVYNKDEIKIVDCYKVNHDIDFSTGDINFNGSVMINGNIRSGFTVESHGNMEITGVVEGATIISKGNIFVYRGIQGHTKGEVRCDGTLITRFIENATINIKEKLVAEVIMHSHVSSENSISVEGTKGLIIGGLTQARTQIKALSIGSEMGTKTTIEVGTNPRLKVNVQNVETRLNEIRKNMQELEQSINVLKKGALAGELSKVKRLLLIKMIKNYEIAKTNYHKDKERLKLYKEEIQSSRIQGKVIVKHKIHPGVKIIIGNEVLFVRETIKHAKIFQHNGKIIIEPIT